MSKVTVIGIAGGSGSGKTRFLKKLFETTNSSEMSLLSMDNYYYPIGLQKKDHNGIENFDRPESINRKKFHADLLKLKAGTSLQIEEYNFNHRNIKPNIISIQASPVIVVEGLFTFYFEEISKEIDLKLFIESSEHLMLKRRIIRDSKERGYGLEDVLYRYEEHVIPAYKKYIEPFKYNSDLIIPNNNDFNAALEVLKSYIRQIVKN